MSGIDPNRKRNEPIVRREPRATDAAPQTQSAAGLPVEDSSKVPFTRDHCVVHEPNVFANAFRRSAADVRSQASIRCEPAEIPSSPRQAALILDLERLRHEGQSWHVVRARLSHEEPSDLQILYRTPGMKEWFASTATLSQLIDTVERIGGPLSQQMEWLNFAGVTLAPSAVRRELVLSAGDEALLERFDRYRSVAQLEVELAEPSDDKNAPRTDREGNEYVKVPNHSKRLETLREEFRTALCEAGLDEAKWKREKEAFQGLFRAHALSTAHRMLRTSAREIARERTRYVDADLRTALQKAIEPLQQKQLEIASLRANAAIKDVVDTVRKPLLRTAGLPPDGALMRAEAEYRALRDSLAASFPVLHEPTIDLSALKRSTSEAHREIRRAADACLASIAKTHGEIDADTNLVFGFDRVKAETKTTLGIQDGSAADILIKTESERVAKSETVKEMRDAALTISLGLLTLVGGPIGLAASALGTTLGVLSTVDSAQKYSIKSSASQTHFDRAKALSSEDPSAFWLAVDIAATVFDVGAFAKTFTALHDTARAALHATSPVEIERAHARLVHLAGHAPEHSVVDVDELASAVVNAFERERERTALLAANANAARVISGAHPTLSHEALTGLLRLNDAARAAVFRAFAGDTRLLQRLGHFADAHAAAARGIDRLFQVADDSTAVTLAREIASWRNSSRAQALLERLGGARVNAEDLDELTHAIAARASASAKAETLDSLARRYLPATRSEIDDFAHAHDVPAVVNQVAGDRDVRVYFVATDGRVDDIQLDLGARTTLEDLELHRETIEKIAEYRGLLGRARSFVDDVREKIRLNVIRPGTPAYRHALESQKLPEIIRRREAQLAGSFTPARRAALEEEIASLKAQLDAHQRGIADDLPELELEFVAQLSPEARAVRRQDRLNAFPQYRTVARLEGRTFADIEGTPELKRIFDANYYRRQDQVIYRRDGKTGDVPLLRIESTNNGEPGRLRFADVRQSDPPIPLPRVRAADVAVFLEEHSESWTEWKKALVSNDIMSEEEIAALIDRTMAGKDAPKTVDRLKEALKDATRSKFVAHCFDGVDDAAASAQRLRSFVFELNPADQGSIAELWYCRYSEKYLGRKIEPHVRMSPADNPGLESVRVPDNLHIEGRELGEVKSTRNGLNDHDTKQIEAMLGAIERRNGAIVVKNGAAHRVDRLRVTFIDPKGAVESVGDLRDWLQQYPKLTIEVFDERGKLHVLTTADRRSFASRESLMNKLNMETRKAQP